MEFQKIVNFLDTTSDDKDLPRFVTKKWIEVYDQSGGNYNVNKEIRIKAPMLRSDLCDYSDAYIVVKRDIVLTKANGKRVIDIRNRFLAFKNNASFTNCISKINNVLIDNAEDLDVVMPMYNLLECSKNYTKTTGSLWNYYRDEPNDFPANNYNANPITNSASFKYKTSITGKYQIQIKKTVKTLSGIIQRLKKGLETVVPLKRLSNFWRTLDMTLISCEVSLTLTWSENRV